MSVLTAAQPEGNMKGVVKKMALIAESEFDSFRDKVKLKAKDDWDKIKQKVIDDTSAYYEFSNETDEKDVVKLLEDILDNLVDATAPGEAANALLPYMLEQAMLQGVKAKNFIKSPEDLEAAMGKAMPYNAEDDAGVVCSICGSTPGKWLIAGHEAKWFRFNGSSKKGVCISCNEKDNGNAPGKKGFVQEWHGGNNPGIPAPDPLPLNSTSDSIKG